MHEVMPSNCLFCSRFPLLLLAFKVVGATQCGPSSPYNWIVFGSNRPEKHNVRNKQIDQRTGRLNSKICIRRNFNDFYNGGHSDQETKKKFSYCIFHNVLWLVFNMSSQNSISLEAVACLVHAGHRGNPACFQGKMHWWPGCCVLSGLGGFDPNQLEPSRIISHNII